VCTGLLAPWVSKRARGGNEAVSEPIEPVPSPGHEGAGEKFLRNSDAPAHYRLDLFRGGAVIPTIQTDEASTRIPLTWPNAGRVSRLTSGTYAWTVPAASSGPSQVLAHGSFTVR